MKRRAVDCLLPLKPTLRATGIATVLLLCVSCSSAAVPVGTPTPALPPTETPLPTLTPVPTPAVGGLYVDAAQNLGAISPLVFGTNYGPWLFVPLPMQEAAKAARLTIIGFPGGNWGDQNDLDEWQIDQFITDPAARVDDTVNRSPSRRSPPPHWPESSLPCSARSQA